MARERDSLADVLRCGVCWENYDENGEHIPRLLPCSHTVCESCIKDIMTKTTLKCPECRKKHRCTNGEKSFPQNKYLLIHICGNKNDAKTSNESACSTDNVLKKRCREHGQELILHCFEETCKKSICISCLEDHSKHDVKGIDTKEKHLLKKELKLNKMKLEERLKLLAEAGKNVADKTDKFVNDLKKTKDDFIRCFDKLIGKAECKGNETKSQTDEEVSAITTSIEILNNIQENLESPDVADHETVKNYHETVGVIMENNKKILSGARSFKFPVFNTDGLSTDMISERVTSVEHMQELSDRQDVESEVPNQIQSQKKSSGTRSFVFPVFNKCSKRVMSVKQVQKLPNCKADTTSQPPTTSVKHIQKLPDCKADTTSQPSTTRVKHIHELSDWDDVESEMLHQIPAQISLSQPRCTGRHSVSRNSGF